MRVEDFHKIKALKVFPKPFLEWSFAKLPPFKVSHITGVRSKTGAEAEGWFIFLPMTPRYLLGAEWPRLLPKIVRAGRIAERLGAQILGLGAFTKIVGDRGISVNDALDVPVTTGNSYTAATSVEGALAGAERMGVDLAQAEVAVIGATGSIGAACAQVIAHSVKRVQLVARSRDRLELLAERIRVGGGHAEISLDARAAVHNADIVIAVSSATDVVVHPEDFKPGAVVTDVARPRNISAEVYDKRDDVLVIDGGVIRVPGPDLDFHLNFGFPPHMAEACIAETIILALEGRFESFTLGRDITVEQVEEIMRLGRKHGFELAGFRRFEKAISDDEIERIRANAMRRKAEAGQAQAAGG